MDATHRYWIVDTSSLLRVREAFARAEERRILGLMTSLVSKGCLFFPPEVFHELERGAARPNSVEDSVLRWAKSVRSNAERPASLETVKAVLAEAPDLIDPDNPAEQADPYVLALAIDTRGIGFDVTVVTDDIKDKPGKLGLATAAGMLRLPSVPLTGFVRSLG